jgi:hypothetical protein
VTELIDVFTLIGLFSFPAYAIYWLRYHIAAARRHRLWLMPVAFVVWCAATWYCFLRLMTWCLGGNCAGKVSPFLEFAMLYAATSAALILVLHQYRAMR